jgi:hypothetical protein
MRQRSECRPEPEGLLLGSGTERVSGRIYRLCPALGLPEGDISRGTGGDDVVGTLPLTGNEAPLPPPQPANERRRDAKLISA